MERTAKIVCAALVLALHFNSTASAQAASTESSQSKGPGANGPTGFEENKGQVRQTDGRPAPDVKFRLSSGGTNIFLLENGIAYQFHRSRRDPDFARLDAKMHRTPEEEARLASMKADARVETYRMDVILEGADPDALITSTGRSADYSNYYNHPEGLDHASLDVRTYKEVVYHNVYPGVDWSFSMTEEGIEQDFLVAPGADPSMIKLRFKDHEELFVDDAGSLIHGNRLGRFTEERPVSWQGTTQVRTDFRLEGDLLSFSIGGYDPSRTLRIDPPRIWATYYGGTSGDIAQGVAVDAAGSSYMAGWTESLNAIASISGYDLSLSGPPDCFLVKFDQGGQRVWGTYYGGTGEDRFGYCALSGTSLYASGLSASPGIATVHQTTLGGGIWDGLLAKFTTDGAFVWSTYYGGDQEDKARHCATDPLGNVYMAGHTFSDHPPNQGVISSGGNVHQATYGGFTDGDDYYTGDGFLVKFNSAGTREWGTYYGGSNDDEAYGCATDLDGNVYISGATQPLSGPAIAPPGGHQTQFGLGAGGALDGYLAKFNTNGQRQWGTYYGGNGSELGYDCTTDNFGNVYLAGVTTSDGPFEVIAYGIAHQPTYAGGSGDGFLVKFNPDGVRIFGTYHGGTGYDAAYGCKTDGVGRGYLTGVTQSSNAAALALYPHQATLQGTEDAFLAGFAPDGSWTWGTYYGGSGNDAGYTVCALTDQAVFLTGQTSSDAPPNGAISQDPGWQTSYGGNSDAYLVKFDYRIDCDGIPGGDAQVGAGCSDGNTCTANDVINVNCVCTGTPTSTTPTVSLVANPAGTICDGTTVVFTATASGTGGGAVTYDFDLNGVTAQNNSSNTWTAAIFEDGDQVVCTITVIGGSCLSTTQAVSQTITMDVGSTVTPQVSISANPSGAICAGTSVTFTAAPGNTGGGTVSYQWKLNGANVGTNSATYTNAGLANGNQVGCVITVTGGSCLSSTTATSNTITMVVTTSITPTVSISANPSGAICASTSVTFTAAPNNTGGGTVSYQWKLNGANVGTNSSTYTNASLANNDLVSCVITVAGGSCLNSTTATSNVITMVVTTSITPSVTLSANPTGTICDGTTVVFTATASGTGGGVITYDFDLNGVTAQNNSSNSLSLGILQDGDQVDVTILVSGGSCLSTTQATSQTITVDVGSSITPSVSITADPGDGICAGTSVTFTAAPSNTGGGTVSYQWKLNGANVGTNSSTYTNASLANNALVSCVVTVAGGSCLSSTTATSNTITMTVTPSVTPSVSISADPSGTVCATSSVTFTATPGNLGGGTVSYQWQRNGGNVGTNSATYTNGSWVNNDQVKCIITVTNGTCLGSTTATSNTITMTVTTSVTPSVSITADPSGAVCTNTSVTFTATPGNLGGGTASYQWQRNGGNVGTNSATYTNASWVNNDDVECVITVANGTCLSATTATSNTITMVVTASITPSVTLVADPAGTICAETSVTFTATAAGTGGGDVTYDFELNGVTAQDGTSNVLDLATLEDGDVVVCTITVSGGACLSTTQATSGTLTIDVASSITPVVSITAEPAGPICANTSVTFTAAPSNTGGGDITYDFQVDGVSMQNGASSTYNSSALVDGAEVTCVITVADGGCLSSTTATDTETITVNPLPTAFDVTGGGLYCQGEEGLVIGLDDSQTGVEYQLFLDGSQVANAVGNNNAISFPAQSVPGAYTVVAISASECSQQMNGSATITLDSADGDGDGIPNCSDGCPGVAGEIGSPCDDGIAETLNDQLDSLCECHGQECSPGNACSDGDDCTINDTWDSGCVCTGVGLVLGPIQGNTLLADGIDYTFAATVFTNDFNMTPVPAAQFQWLWSTVPADNDWYSADWTQSILTAHADSSNGPVELCVTVTIGSCPALEACMTVMVVDVGIAENSGADLFSVRPNPSTGRFQIVGDPRVGLLRLTVEDATGRAIAMVTENSGANRIVDLGDAVPGIYLLRLWHDHGAQVLRLVVRR